MKYIFGLIIYLLSFSLFAFPFQSHSSCPQALPTTNPGFCASFKSVATCHCTESGLPMALCQDINRIYAQMIAIYHTVENACSPKAQKDTDQQTCIDDWNCYLHGGRNSKGELCSATGKACQ